MNHNLIFEVYLVEIL